MDELIEKLESIEELILPNGATGAVWLDDVIEVVKETVIEFTQQQNEQPIVSEGLPWVMPPEREIIKNETVMTSQHIDRIDIVEMVEIGKTDEEIGKIQS